MTREKQRITIAEACGWTIVKNYGNGGLYGYHYRQPSYDVAECPPGAVPNYVEDLNAIHEAERLLFGKVGWTHYSHVLLGDDVHASAPRRARALLDALGLWEA